MDSRMITTNRKDVANIAAKLAGKLNCDGYMTMIESIPGGRRLKLTKRGVFRTMSGLSTCVDVDITTTDGGLLVNFYPSVFKENFAATMLTMFVFWPVIFTQIAGWINRSNLKDDICDEISIICNKAAA